MIKVICDLCGTEIQSGHEHYEMMIGKRPNGIDFDSAEDFPSDVELYHVCPDCVGAWGNFMNNRQLERKLP